MNKTEFYNAVAADLGITKVESEDICRIILSNIIRDVTAGNKVSLIGFGTFHSAERGPRTRHNPRTGGEFNIPADTKVRFIVSKVFKEAVNSPSST